MQNHSRGFQPKKTNTQPVAELQLNASFLFLMERFHLSILQVAQASGVRLPTVWRIIHRLPVSSIHAAHVRKGVHKLTSLAYTGPIDVFSEVAHLA